MQGETKLVRSTGVGYSIPEFSRACLIRLIDYPQMPLRTRTAGVVKAGNTALIVRTELPVGSQMVPVAYKRVRRRNWFKRLTSLFRTNRLLRTWRMGQLCLERGVNTARPLAVIVPRRSRAGDEAFLVTQWIDGSQNLSEFCRWLDAVEPIHRLWPAAAAAKELGELVGRMHAAGIAHRDLKPGNLLVTVGAGRIDANLIDLDGAALRFNVPRARRAQNLARLIVGVAVHGSATTAAKLRFLKSYLAASGEAAADWKSWWNELAVAAEELAEAKRRRAA